MWAAEGERGGREGQVCEGGLGGGEVGGRVGEVESGALCRRGWGVAGMGGGGA